MLNSATKSEQHNNNSVLYKDDENTSNMTSIKQTKKMFSQWISSIDAESHKNLCETFKNTMRRIEDNIQNLKAHHNSQQINDVYEDINRNIIIKLNLIVASIHVNLTKIKLTGGIIHDIENKINFIKTLKHSIHIYSFIKQDIIFLQYNELCKIINECFESLNRKIKNIELSSGRCAFNHLKLYIDKIKLLRKITFIKDKVDNIYYEILVSMYNKINGVEKEVYELLAKLSNLNVVVDYYKLGQGLSALAELAWIDKLDVEIYKFERIEKDIVEAINWQLFNFKKEIVRLSLTIKQANNLNIAQAIFYRLEDMVYLSEFKLVPKKFEAECKDILSLLNKKVHTELIYIKEQYEKSSNDALFININQLRQNRFYLEKAELIPELEENVKDTHEMITHYLRTFALNIQGSAFHCIDKISNNDNIKKNEIDNVVRQISFLIYLKEKCQEEYQQIFHYNDPYEDCKNKIINNLISLDDQVKNSFIEHNFGNIRAITNRLLCFLPFDRFLKENSQIITRHRFYKNKYIKNKNMDANKPSVSQIFFNTEHKSITHSNDNKKFVFPEQELNIGQRQTMCHIL